MTERISTKIVFAISGTMFIVIGLFSKKRFGKYIVGIGLTFLTISALV